MLPLSQDFSFSCTDLHPSFCSLFLSIIIWHVVSAVILHFRCRPCVLNWSMNWSAGHMLWFWRLHGSSTVLWAPIRYWAKFILMFALLVSSLYPNQQLATAMSKASDLVYLYRPNSFTISRDLTELLHIMLVWLFSGWICSIKLILRLMISTG